MECDVCGEEMGVLDTIIDKYSGVKLWTLYVCHNEDCDAFGEIYTGDGKRGDPSGLY